MVTFTPETELLGPPGREAQEPEGHLSSWATAIQIGLRGSQVPLAAGQESQAQGEE